MYVRCVHHSNLGALGHSANKLKRVPQGGAPARDPGSRHGTTSAIPTGIRELGVRAFTVYAQSVSPMSSQALSNSNQHQQYHRNHPGFFRSQDAALQISQQQVVRVTERQASWHVPQHYHITLSGAHSISVDLSHREAQ